MKRSYDELITYDTFIDRFRYLKLDGQTGIETFGFDRYLNQRFYRSAQWQKIRQRIIARDLGLDLGVEGYEIHTKLLIHHINPLTEEDLRNGSPIIINPQNLITTSHRTHNAIHFGDESLITQDYEPRKPGDTLLW